MNAKRNEPAPTGRHDASVGSDRQWYAHRETRGAPTNVDPQDLYRQRLEVEDVRDVLDEMRRWGSY